MLAMPINKMLYMCIYVCIQIHSENITPNGKMVAHILLLLLCVTVATPLWPSVRVKVPNTSKVGDLESSGTPKCLEFDSKVKTPRIEVFLVSLERY
jgi:hypothetical protein